MSFNVGLQGVTGAKETVQGAPGVTGVRGTDCSWSSPPPTGLTFLNEAKHSLATLIVVAGNPTAALPILMKWPDALEASMSCKSDVLFRDLDILICAPIKMIAEVLATGRTPKERDEHALKEISETYAAFQAGKCTSIETKNNLIRLCNMIIFKLRQKGHNVIEYIKPLGGEK